MWAYRISCNCYITLEWTERTDDMQNSSKSDVKLQLEVLAFEEPVLIKYSR